MIIKLDELGHSYKFHENVRSLPSKYPHELKCKVCGFCLSISREEYKSMVVEINGSYIVKNCYEQIIENVVL